MSRGSQLRQPVSRKPPAGADLDRSLRPQLCGADRGDVDVVEVPEEPQPRLSILVQQLQSLRGEIETSFLTQLPDGAVDRILGRIEETTGKAPPIPFPQALSDEQIFIVGVSNDDQRAVRALRLEHPCRDPDGPGAETSWRAHTELDVLIHSEPPPPRSGARVQDIARRLLSARPAAAVAPPNRAPEGEQVPARSVLPEFGQFFATLRRDSTCPQHRRARWFGPGGQSLRRPTLLAFAGIARRRLSMAGAGDAFPTAAAPLRLGSPNRRP